MSSSPSESEPLVRLLWRAHHWFRAALTAAFEAQEDGVTISGAHVTLLSQLPSEGASIAELARRLGVSAPTAHQWVHELVALSVVTVERDPRSARSKLVRLTAAGAQRRSETMQILSGLETALAGRIGVDTAIALRAALEEPWGSPESAAAELSDRSTRLRCQFAAAVVSRSLQPRASRRSREAKRLQQISAEARLVRASYRSRRRSQRVARRLN